MKKLDIGILNFHFSNNNYGAVLQTYALQKYLQSIGYSSENIDLKPKVYWKSRVLEKLLGNPFEEFRAKYLKISKKSFYKDSNEFKKYSVDYKFLIVGSDQVWRPSYCEFPEAYFLNFAEENQLKISYAASFGVDYWENKSEIEKYKKFLSYFDAVSVREDSGLSICSKDFGILATHVLDPTLLVDKISFEKLLLDIEEDKNKIVYYKLDQDEDFINSITFLSNTLNTISEDIYFEEVHFFGKLYKKFKSIPYWLTAIAKSKMVVTDSYHCVCFALIFEKDFIYYVNKNNRGLTRIQSLLKILNLEDRIVTSLEDIKKKVEWSSNPIDYVEVNKKIEVLKSQSADFLKNALTKIK